MTRYRYRRYEPGDEQAINELYFSVTGRKRSVSQFLWQWQDAPGGKGEVWLIEVIKTDGTPKLIGHHGLMPIVFSYGKFDLLAGKTENTMVLPEYRSKILYPKYEKIFLSHYEKSFDLLFSTMGPPAALRQRLSLGYEAKKKWLSYEWSLGPGSIFSRIASTSATRDEKKIYRILEVLCSNIGKYCNKLFPFRNKREVIIPLQILHSDEAKTHSFFVDFWDKARHVYGLTPRRNREDLQWRFWENPYGTHTTLLCDGYSDSGGYAIVRDLGNQNFRLEDFVIYPLDQIFFSKMLNAVCEWVYTKGGNVLFFNTVADHGILTSMFQNFSQPDLRVSVLFRWLQQPEIFMPRRLTGRSAILNDHSEKSWYITPFVLEGRL